MKITPFFLDSNNQTIVSGKTIASRVSGQGKLHLWEERTSAVIDTVVIHYASAEAVDPKRRFDMRRIAVIFCDLGVSCHYLIDRSGKTFSMVPEAKKAWHCGGSIMPRPDDRRMVNAFSIGIELIATPVSGFTQKQYGSLTRLSRDIEKRHGRPMVYVGHEDIAGKRAVALGLRKDLKTDPGAGFNWDRFFHDLRRPSKTLKPSARRPCR